MDLSRRDLSEAQILKVTEVGRFVEQADNSEGDFVVSVNPIKEITKDVSGVSSEINMPAEDVETPSIDKQSGMVAEGTKQTEIDQSIETGADELAAKEKTKEAIANTSSMKNTVSSFFKSARGAFDSVLKSDNGKPWSLLSKLSRARQHMFGRVVVIGQRR
ncbi:hypothetical protein HDU67_001530 [Dinochytrium kinnereticum]|nr:hypothetical protein HDU67_001530 [Dinochytrium kinnereticum]